MKRRCQKLFHKPVLPPPPKGAPVVLRAHLNEDTGEVMGCVMVWGKDQSMLEFTVSDLMLEVFPDEDGGSDDRAL